MEKIGKIEIKVTGKVGNKNLNPQNYDIRYLVDILKDVQYLLYPNSKDRPLISYNIKEGSVTHIFNTTTQGIISFSAILENVKESKSIDFLEHKTARAIENIQELALKKEYRFEFSTSIKREVELIIDASTHFFRSEDIWVDAEFYFYGTLTNAGGKNKANIHLDTAEYGSIIIDTGKDFLAEKEENILYKKLGVRAIGKQNIDTGEIDTSSLKLIEFIDYNPKYDPEYLDSLIEKAKGSWKDIDTDKWLHEIRGTYDG